jgi:hypothetical protein
MCIRHGVQTNIYIYITCFLGIYVLSEVGVQIELLILRYYLGKMCGDGVV